MDSAFKFDIYKDIQMRTSGEIFLGVVGPVRTGKSTFIKRFMDLWVIPAIENEKCQDSLHVFSPCIQMPLRFHAFENAVAGITKYAPACCRLRPFPISAAFPFPARAARPRSAAGRSAVR